MGEKNNPDEFTRRSFLGKTSAVLAMAATSPILAAAQQTVDKSGDNHIGTGEDFLRKIARKETVITPE